MWVTCDVAFRSIFSCATPTPFFYNKVYTIFCGKILCVNLGINEKVMSKFSEKAEDIFYTIIFILFLIVIGGWVIGLINWIAGGYDKKCCK